MPSQIGLPTNKSDTSCPGTQLVVSAVCETTSDYNGTVTISSVEWIESGGIYRFQFTNIKNPFSNQISDGFSGFYLEQDEGYLVADWDGTTDGI